VTDTVRKKTQQNCQGKTIKTYDTKKICAKITDSQAASSI